MARQPWAADSNVGDQSGWFAQPACAPCLTHGDAGRVRGAAGRQAGRDHPRAAARAVRGVLPNLLRQGGVRTRASSGSAPLIATRAVRGGVPAAFRGQHLSLPSLQRDGRAAGAARDWPWRLPLAVRRVYSLTCRALPRQLQLDAHAVKTLMLQLPVLEEGDAESTCRPSATCVRASCARFKCGRPL